MPGPARKYWQASDFGPVAQRLRHVSAFEVIENRQRAAHRKFVRHRMERLRAPAHHVAVEHARKDVHFHVLHTRWYLAIGVQHLERRPVVQVAPNNTDGLTDAIKFLDVVQHLRSMAGDARCVAEALWPE